MRKSCPSRYAAKGLVGLLTPQANTTVEPEVHVLSPSSVGFLNARMTSSGNSVEARLVDYGKNVEKQVSQFANAPLDAFALAVTGTSYFLGPKVEDQMVERFQQNAQRPLVTAARALCDGLDALEARSIALLSPYDDTITRRSIDYWSARGYEVTAVTNVKTDPNAFHPIYALSPDMAEEALDEMDTTHADAVLLLGTGMPTLPLIEKHYVNGEAPLLSSVLALVWRSVLAVENRPPDRDGLDVWLSGANWRHRLE